MKASVLVAIILLLCLSCSGSDDAPEGMGFVSPEDSFEWIVPGNEINGSGIPFALAKDPKLFTISSVDFMDEDARVAVIKIDNEIRVYPYQYISRYESVNEEISDKSFAITYCPITKSAIAMDRNYSGQNFLFRASGYLYNDNLILVDQSSSSFWSQMLGQCIKGPFEEERIHNRNLVEMPFKTVKSHFPDAKIFTSSSLPEPGKMANASKDEIEEGELVFGIVDPSPGKTPRAYVYPWKYFEEQPSLKELTVGGKKTMVIGGRKDHFIAAFYNDSGGAFQAIPNQFPIVMKDNQGNLWDVFGTCTSGYRKGDQLESPLGYFALFWAWESFFEEIVLNQ